jgi:hypothetical protein
LAGIQVVATGIGYGYFAEKYTDDDGCFELEAKALGPVAIYAQSRLLRSQAIRVLAPAAGMMRDIGMLPVGARTNSCPGVMEECGGRCIEGSTATTTPSPTKSLANFLMANMPGRKRTSSAPGRKANDRPA